MSLVNALFSNTPTTLLKKSTLISPLSLSPLPTSTIINLHSQSFLLLLLLSLMGNGVTKVVSCLTSTSSSHHSHRRRRRHDTAAVVSEPFCYDEGLGHSFCYVRPEPFRLSSSKVYNHEEKEREKERGKEDFSNPAGTTTFRSISGASISANTSTTPLSDLPLNTAGTIVVAAATFDCSDSFSSVPLQPIPRSVSGPLCGQLERGFLSGPIERGGFFSGPLDPKAGISIGIFSGPLELRKNNHQYSHYLRRSFSHGLSRKANLIRGLKRVIARTISFGQNAIVAPMKKDSLDVIDAAVSSSSRSGGGGESGDQSLDGLDQSNLHWAQGKAGEDRVHVVISEEYGWVFVGIYDGFNGPDAPDYLLSNLYPAVERELKGILCDENRTNNNRRNDDTSSDQRLTGDEVTKGKIKISKKKKSKRMLKSDWDMERLELDRKLKEQLSSSTITAAVDHNEVLKVLSRALKSTEENYLDVADSMVSENPELALMGSCVLVMLMKGEDVYLVNVGDSRAVLGRKPEPDASDPIKEEESSPLNRDGLDDDFSFPTLASLQLTSDHSTCVEEEVRRIKKEHPEDPSAVINDRVKGSLKVTRAFGAGFLKQPRWNEALLEMFRVDYVGSSPYITCNPSLHHHKLGRRDRFLILSSDGLYQYLTNEQAVAEVELFIAMYPDGDPAQHLVEEVLFRAAKKAGMEFHELLEIPQGDRRRYHDDVSIIVISLEGRIWRSCV